MGKIDFAAKRKELVEDMVARGTLRSKNVQEAFLTVPREKFFLPEILDQAYVDHAFPIGSGQTISQPSTIAVMLEMLAVQRGNNVLEVGAGSGYVAALLSELVGDQGNVFAVEMIHELCQRAIKTLVQLGYKNVHMNCCDGGLGWKEKAPFDRIIISAACNEAPLPLIKQLKEQGKLVAPVGGKYAQDLILIEKEKGKGIEKTRQGSFVFVPLRGKHGQ